tara:strand:+ start:270 stop:656 length:387 start_codon:yes stop_codon:yes gene_type:complete
MRENEFITRLENVDVSIYGFEKWKGRDDNNDISAVAVIHWDFYTEMRSWGVKDIGAYATYVHIEFEVSWWNENDEEEIEEYSIDSEDGGRKDLIKWEIETEIDMKLGDCICPQDVEVDYETKTITINF